MRALIPQFFVVILCALSLRAVGDVRYVDINNSNPIPPYTNWATAATNIQAAIDVAATGDEVLVADGIYATGTRAVYDGMLNRVAVTRPITVRSVNGPATTIIRGHKLPGSIYGSGAVRCVYLTNGALLAGFTLTNGATMNFGDFKFSQTGGGVWCESNSGVLSNCVLVGNASYSSGGGAYEGTLYNCVITNNEASTGGGTAYSTLYECDLLRNSARNYGGAVYTGLVFNCTFISNSASIGGGAFNSILNNCHLEGNFASSRGGGADISALTNCLVTNNLARDGGGVSYSTLDHCTLKKNAARYFTSGINSIGGGGAYSSTLNNCTVAFNFATNSGGGVYGGTVKNSVLNENSALINGGGASESVLQNCTVTGNSAREGSGGGTFGGTHNNCIVYFNNAPTGPNHFGGNMAHCCTTPLPTGGMGNFIAEPQLASLSHLSANSPCRGSGNPAYASGVDVDGNNWLNPPSVGCDEFQPGTATGPLTVGIKVTHTNVATGYEVDFIAETIGLMAASSWDFDDGTMVSNRPYASHSWATAGDYTVVLRAFNESYPAGLSATVTVHVVEQPIHYVAEGGVAPQLPFNSWATAATNIQDAIDAASVVGALVLVSNGVYSSGGRAVFGTMTNRVAVTRLLTVQSVNGPGVTVIQGKQIPVTTNGNGAIRCAYLTNGSRLSGFTLAGGATRTAGDAPREQGGGGVWCESASAIVTNCIITSCVASSGNSATGGGAAFGGTLDRCVVSNNSAGWGGGVYKSTVRNCLLFNNRGGYGGGAYKSVLQKTTLMRNIGHYGGGAYDCQAYSSAFVENTAGADGGGADGLFATLNHCTLVGNRANRSGGGVAYGKANNCIVYYNAAKREANYTLNTDLRDSCTTPVPTNGLGNSGFEPQLASLSHLSANSPCIAKGNSTYTTGWDIDGEQWANPPSIGCDEAFVAADGPLNVKVDATYTNVATDFEVKFTARIDGRVSMSRWEFDDGATLSNRPYVSRSWSAAGAYPVTLRAFNETHPGGVTATVIVQVVEATHYVNVASINPQPPYSTWATAAGQIQQAIDAATVVGARILVTNGVYESGGRVVYGALTNRVAVNKVLALRSVNGPTVTVIKGAKPPHPGVDNVAVRCVYLTNDATLTGFTIDGGSGSTPGGDAFLEASGGGIWCESDTTVIAKCIITNNSARYVGGGIYKGTINNCLIVSNTADYYGGGSYDGLLRNCTLVGNQALLSDGGFSSGFAQNSLAYFNSAPSNPNHGPAFLDYCCTTPLPSYGSGNFTNAPSFANLVTGNFHLQASSPCLNAGKNPLAPMGSELEGNPRIVGGTVDIGAYEFQSPTSVLSYAWAQQYGLATDGSADFQDSDNDGLNNWEEWMADTIPTNAVSALRLLHPIASSLGVTLSWESVATRSYWLERSSNLVTQASFSVVASNLPGQATTTLYADTNTSNGSVYFYRVGVEP